MEKRGPPFSQSISDFDSAAALHGRQIVRREIAQLQSLGGVGRQGTAYDLCLKEGHHWLNLITIKVPIMKMRRFPT